MAVVKVITNAGLLGLKFVDGNMNDMVDCRNNFVELRRPPTEEQLMTLSRAMLVELGMIVAPTEFRKSSTKLMIASYVIRQWDAITMTAAVNCPDAVGSVFDVRLGGANAGGAGDADDEEDNDGEGEEEEGSQEEDEEEEGSDDSDVPSEVQPPKSLEEHAFKDDEGNSTDVLKLGDVNGRFAVEVIVPKKHGETRVIYSYNNSTTGIDLIHDLSEAVGATIDPRMCSIKCGASRIELFESLHGYAYNAESIRLEIRVKGGALVRKSYVRKDDRMAALVKKSKAFIAKRFDERMEVEGVMPESLRHFLVPIQDRMNNFKQNIMSGQVSLRVAMETMDDSKVSAIIDLLESTKKTNTEERLYRLSPLVLQDVASIDQAMAHLHNGRIDLIEMLIDIFAREYSMEKSGEMLYNVENFVRDLRGLQDYRRGLRRIAEASPEDEARPEGGCEIM